MTEICCKCGKSAEDERGIIYIWDNDNSAALCNDCWYKKCPNKEPVRLKLQ